MLGLDAAEGLGSGHVDGVEGVAAELRDVFDPHAEVEVEDLEATRVEG